MGPLAIFSLLLFISRTLAVAGALDDLVIDTTSGRVQGYLDTNTTSISLKKWLGVPYADDTSGKNRWRPPQPVKVAAMVFNATAYGPACIQGRCVCVLRVFSAASHSVRRADGGNGTYIQSEDCLRINIIAPSNASGLPVYLYSQYVQRPNH